MGEIPLHLVVLREGDAGDLLFAIAEGEVPLSNPLLRYSNFFFVFITLKPRIE